MLIENPLYLTTYLPSSSLAILASFVNFTFHVIVTKIELPQRGKVCYLV